MAIKTTSRKTTTEETITFTEEQIIAALAKAYNLPMKGPDQYDAEVDVSSAGLLRGINFRRIITELPIHGTENI